MTKEELLEWAKRNKTKKPDDMSEKDYELTMNQANYTEQQGLLDQNLASQKAALKQAQTTAQQAASVSLDKLMKYINQNQISSGLAAGQKGTDYINAQNAYMQNRANIAQGAAQSESELLNAYASQKLQSEQNQYNNLVSILDKYRNRGIEDEDRQSNKDLEWIATAQEALGGTGLSYGVYDKLLGDQEELTSEDKEKFLSELEKYRSKMSPEAFEKLMALYSGLLYSK